MKLAKFIKARREQQGLSLRDVAKKGGMSLGGVHDMETGRTIDPHVSNLLALSKGLKVKPELLLAAARESLETPANTPEETEA